MQRIRLRPFERADTGACLAPSDSNLPNAFALGVRIFFADWLRDHAFGPRPCLVPEAARGIRAWDGTAV
ncbi:hypothetical protein [Falsigemmobacter faecalis]|uniref:Uncharacterized protein n=1 Tax=Falsigemmobacter faecalis TaxID=2488730 RepID=A0A3P3DQA3_9RHOB|nr:hypothetical protein [Falsigemmobacter faecalis]RRH76420.1 hypothetical protein EG244_06605 [Falsigemmobacter faecalis]